MAMQQIDGARQVKSGTITTTQLASSAGITDGQLATPYIKADGTRALTGALSMGSNQLNNLATPTSSSDAATKGYVDSMAQGLPDKYSADAATNTETLTIASGSVTQITGTTVNGVSPGVGDYVLIMNAPASTGAAGGTTLSSQPANGLYQITNNTTNLTVSRAVDMSSANGPFGAYVFVVGGSVWGGGGFVVTTPSTPAAFTYGTGNIAFTQFSGAGEITVDSTLTKTANQLSRAAITGDVAISSGSNTSAIGANKVTLGMQATLAANSVIGNSTGSTATPTAVPLAAAATASAIALRDGNANLTTNSLIEAVATIATAAGTTTLVVGSAQLQQFTGTTTQTVVMPNATTMSNGQSFFITNRSTGAVTVNANGGGLLQTMAASSQCEFTLISNGTSAGTWDVAYSITNAGSGGGSVTSVSVASANGFAGTVATSTTTPAITITTSITGVLKGNGTAISAATAGTDYVAPGGALGTPSSGTLTNCTGLPVAGGGTGVATLTGIVKGNGTSAFSAAVAGTDYMAPSDFVTRESSPFSGVNGSTTVFTLVNTPISGTEHIYQNGLLLRAGSGNDYTISGASVTFTTAPAGADFICASYQK
jgi:hypothetical protein